MTDNTRALLEQVKAALESCTTGGYVDIDGDFQRTYRFSESLVDNALEAIRAELAKPTQEERLYKAAESLLSNANWNVGGVLSSESQIREFPSNGIAKVRLRDLARLRVALKNTDAPTPAQHDSPEADALKAQRDELLAALKAMYSEAIRIRCSIHQKWLQIMNTASAAIAKAERSAL